MARRTEAEAARLAYELVVNQGLSARDAAAELKRLGSPLGKSRVAEIAKGPPPPAPEPAASAPPRRPAPRPSPPKPARVSTPELDEDVDTEANPGEPRTAEHDLVVLAARDRAWFESEVLALRKKAKSARQTNDLRTYGTIVRLAKELTVVAAELRPKPPPDPNSDPALILDRERLIQEIERRAARIEAGIAPAPAPPPEAPAP